MKKQKTPAPPPPPTVADAISAEILRYTSRRNKKDAGKRLIYLAALLFCIVVAVLLIQQLRHSDRRPTDVETSQADPRDRGDPAALPTVTLRVGAYTAGVDIKPGRYLVTAAGGFGSFVVYEPGTKLPEISEVLGFFCETAHVPSIAVTLADKQELVIGGSSLQGAVFTPLATKLLTELTTGVWVVGLDIRPGTYLVSSKNGLAGSVTVFEEDLPVARALLGKGGPKFSESETLTLQEGQMIRIANIPTVLFEKF